jgi:hypothetical protein
MSQNDPKQAKRRIETSALDREKVAEIEEKLHRISQIKSAKIRRRDIELDNEDLPLSTVESMIGFKDQGDAFRNDLDLLFDRLQGEATAPEFSPPTPEEDPALEPIAGFGTPRPSTRTPAPARVVAQVETVEASSLGAFNFSDLDLLQPQPPSAPQVPAPAGERGEGAEEEDLPFEALERLMETPPLADEDVDTWNEPESSKGKGQ